MKTDKQKHVGQAAGAMRHELEDLERGHRLVLLDESAVRTVRLAVVSISKQWGHYTSAGQTSNLH